MLLHLTFPLIPLEVTFFLEIKHLQIKRLLVKLESGPSSLNCLEVLIKGQDIVHI